jgi:hypothetical protein
VQQSGFLSHDELLIGCSLDGHLCDYQLIVELKCPRPANHLKYLRLPFNAQVPAEYQWQVLHNLLVSGAKGGSFVSFCPSFPEELQLRIIPITRWEDQIDSYRLLLTQFLREVEDEYQQIAAMAGAAA